MQRLLPVRTQEDLVLAPKTQQISYVQVPSSVMQGRLVICVGAKATSQLGTAMARWLVKITGPPNANTDVKSNQPNGHHQKGHKTRP